MEYVVLINGGDEKLYVDVNVFLERSTKKHWFRGYDWAAMKRHIDMAQQKIDEEPRSAKVWADLRLQRTQHVENLLDELSQFDVGPPEVMIYKRQGE